MNENTLLRFLSKVDKDQNTGCWNWTANKNSWGYGLFWIGIKMRTAHRVSYEHYKGIILDNLCVRHKCDNPSCVNPDHLELGVHADNMKDRDVRGRQKTPCGEANGFSKITEDIVREIRELYSTGIPKQQDIADYYGISVSQVSNIVNRRHWGHIT